MENDESVGVLKVSKKYSLNMDDVASVLKNAAIVGIAAALTAITQTLGNIEMGESTVILIPLVTMGLNALVKWLTNSLYPTKETIEILKKQ